MQTTPLTFSAQSVTTSDVLAAWTSKASGMSVTTDIPKEFAGLGQGFSPEDYYTLALQNCYIATFKVIADKSKLQYEKLEVNVTIVLDKNDEQIMVMKKAIFDVNLHGAANLERANRLLEKTTKSCMILNSVKTELIFDLKVH